jgi:hypothetical protein
MNPVAECGRRRFCARALEAGLAALSEPVFARSLLSSEDNRPWSKAAAWRWYRRQPWLLGFNCIPSTAINSTEMWQKSTFDLPTIEREMRVAGGVGFNCARVFLQYLVWQNDPQGLKERLNQFMRVTAGQGIKILWVLFDDCAFGGGTEPLLGKQPPVVAGEYANGWTPSPGPSRVVNQSDWHDLHKYVIDLLRTFHSDPRVLGWDLYNEPGNTHMGNKSLPLLRAVFTWARQVSPSQPVTVAVWDRGLKQMKEIDETIIANSDVITFHDYGSRDFLLSQITDVTKTGRPLICSEWMARETGSTIANNLPIFYQRRIGSMLWGLVNGKTQTDYHWGSKAGSPPPALWQHDLFHGNPKPYDPSEIALLKKYIGMSHSEHAAASP